MMKLINLEMNIMSKEEILDAINNLNDEEIISKYKMTPKRLKDVLGRIVICLDKIAFARF